jgi:hypothetical protein
MIIVSDVYFQYFVYFRVDLMFQQRCQYNGEKSVRDTLASANIF